MKKKSLRTDIYEYARRKYGSEPEFLWAKYPGYAVFRHTDNNKWYCIVMNVRRSKFGLPGDEYVDVLNVKINDLLMADMLLHEKGFFAGYHMSRSNWISVLLDGTVTMKRITSLIDTSFNVTASTQKKQKLRPPKEWIIPANPRYYDIVHAFDSKNAIEWKQGRSIKKGDTVFMYVGAPVSAVLYKCRVTETDIPCDYRDKNITITGLMKIELVRRYDPERFTFKVLNDEYGIFAVRGPRGIPNSLSCALNEDIKGHL